MFQISFSFFYTFLKPLQISFKFRLNPPLMCITFLLSLFLTCCLTSLLQNAKQRKPNLNPEPALLFSKRSTSVLVPCSGKQVKGMTVSWEKGKTGKPFSMCMLRRLIAMLFLPLPRSHSEALCSWIAILQVHHVVTSQIALTVPAPLAADCLGSQAMVVALTCPSPRVQRLHAPQLRRPGRLRDPSPVKQWVHIKLK